VPPSTTAWWLGSATIAVPRGEIFFANEPYLGWKRNLLRWFKRHMVTNRPELLRRIGAKPGSEWDPHAGIANVEKLFA
jgi:hypothetical protein